jgi:tripartite-type tricarboxylate transporter receptor subunit TctC
MCVCRSASARTSGGWAILRQFLHQFEDGREPRQPKRDGRNKSGHDKSGADVRVRSRRIVWIVGTLLFAALARPVNAAEADFYAGKTLTIIAGLPPGGGVDGEMRVLAQYFSKYIPGHPLIVARNMPGAGGIVLGNYINSIAAPDGLTLAMPGRSGFLLSNVVPQKGIGYDLTKLSYVGGAGSAVNALWVSAKLGIASIADLKTRKPDITIGALTARSENAIAPRVLAAYEGWPLKIVTGYAGFSEVLIAVERGEVDGLFTHEGSIANTRPDMIAAGTLKPVVQSYQSLPNVPVLADVVANADARALLALVTTPSQIGLPLIAPPGIRADRLDILRQSYRHLMEDEDYRAEADRRGLPVGRAVGGAELQALVARSLSGVPEPVVKAYLAFTGLKADD